MFIIASKGTLLLLLLQAWERTCVNIKKKLHSEILLNRCGLKVFSFIYITI